VFSRLRVPHGPDVDPCPPGQFFLRQPQPEPSHPNSCRESVPLGDEPRPKDGFDRRPAARQRDRLVPFRFGDV